MTSLCRHLSVPEIVNWVTTAVGCVHTDDTTKLSPTSCEFVYTPPMRRDSTVSSRRRCVLGIKLTRNLKHTVAGREFHALTILHAKKF